MSPAFALLLQHTNIRHTSPKARNMSRENTSDEAKSRALDFDQRRCQLRAYPRLRLRLRCCCDCAYAHRRAKKKNHKCSCNVRGNSHGVVFCVLLLSCTLLLLRGADLLFPNCTCFSLTKHRQLKSPSYTLRKCNIRMLFTGYCP